METCNLRCTKSSHLYSSCLVQIFRHIQCKTFSDLVIKITILTSLCQRNERNTKNNRREAVKYITKII